MEILDSYGVRVLARQGADSGGAALRSGAKGILHPEPGPGQPVDVTGPDEAVTVRAGVAPAEVVADEDNDVGLRIVGWLGEDGQWRCRQAYSGRGGREEGTRLKSLLGRPWRCHGAGKLAQPELSAQHAPH